MFLPSKNIEASEVFLNSATLREPSAYFSYYSQHCTWKWNHDSLLLKIFHCGIHQKCIIVHCFVFAEKVHPYADWNLHKLLIDASDWLMR